MKEFETSLPAGNGPQNAQELNRQGLAFYQQGHWQAALGCFEAALAASREVGDKTEEATALHHLAGLYCYRLGQRPTAYQSYQQALRLWQEAGNLPGEADSLFGLAGMLQADGRYQEALPIMERLIEIDRLTDSSDLKSHRIVQGAVRRKAREQGSGIRSR